MIKKFLLLFIIMFFAVSSALADQTYTIKAGVSIDKIPKDFYGTWRVTSKLQSTNRDGLFKNGGVDLWNLSRSGDVITLDNPFSGAHASIMVDEIRGNFVKFKKIGDYDNKKLTDIVKMTLSKDTFTGVNQLKLDTVSDVDGHVMVTEWALYQISGEKISGDSIKK